MTIAISLKVNEGIVLASDSASTLVQRNPDGSTGVVNVYNNANKIINLYYGQPVGLITWGVGSIDNDSIEMLAKELRSHLMFSDDPDWRLDISQGISIREVAERVKKFMIAGLREDDHRYERAFGGWAQMPELGFIVAGFSGGRGMGEEYQITITNGACSDVTEVRPRELTGITWNGEILAVARLLLGFDARLPDVLMNNLGVPQSQVPPTMAVVQQALGIPLVMPSMPFQDAIDLARFLVELTINFSRYTPGPPTVGGPIEIAGISRHEGFKWVSRKHYFEPCMNPVREEERRLQYQEITNSGGS